MSSGGVTYNTPPTKPTRIENPIIVLAIRDTMRPSRLVISLSNNRRGVFVVVRKAIYMVHYAIWGLFLLQMTEMIQSNHVKSNYRMA